MDYLEHDNGAASITSDLISDLKRLSFLQDLAVERAQSNSGFIYSILLPAMDIIDDLIYATKSLVSIPKLVAFSWMDMLIFHKNAAQFIINRNLNEIYAYITNALDCSSPYIYSIKSFISSIKISFPTTSLKATVLRPALSAGLVLALISTTSGVSATADELNGDELVSVSSEETPAPSETPTIEVTPTPEPIVGDQVIVEETPEITVVEEVTVIPEQIPLEAPTNLGYQIVAEGIKLTWDRSNSAVDKYLVNLGPENRSIEVSADSSEVLLTDLNRKSIYSFTVIAVSGEIQSAVLGPLDLDLATIKFPRPPMNAEVGGLIVKFNDYLSSSEVTSLADNSQREAVELEISKEISTDTRLVEFNEPVNVATAQEIADSLEASSAVEFAELDFAFTTASEELGNVVPNDPLYATKQWSLWGNFGIGIADGPSGLALAYQNSTGLGVTVAVIDTGFTNHPDLAGQYVSGYDFVSNNEMLSGIRKENGTAVPYDGDYIDSNTYGPIGWDENPLDPGDWKNGSNSSWHGTHVAGLIAALSNNGIGIAGIAPDAKIQPIRAFSWRGGLLSDVIASITWASGGTVENVPTNKTPSKVINLSFSAEAPCTPSLQLAIDDALARGSVVVAAAGNSNQDAANFAPGNCNNVITVGAIDSNGDRASYSNFGDVIDISAPGGELDGQAIYSTSNEGITTATSAAYSVKQGTSIAAAYVSAAIAKIFSSDLTQTPNQVKSILFGPDYLKNFPKNTCDVGDSNCGLGYLFFQPSTVQVSVFTYPGLNGAGFGCDVENDNLKEIINSISGYTVDASITSFSNATTLRSQLDASRFFFMTDMETQTATNTTFLPNNSKLEIKDWVNDGGVMVMTATYGANDVDFLNTIFSWNLSSVAGNSSATWSRNDSNTTGTPFATSQNGRSSPATLTWKSATDSIGKGSVANFKSMWGTDSNATVAVIQYGNGYVIYMGYDFYNTGKSGDSTGGACSESDNDWVKHTIPAALNYASQLSDASLANITGTSVTYTYTYTQSGTTYYVVTPSSSTTPTASQIKAAVNYTGGTISTSGNSSTSANVATNFEISGLTSSTSYVIYAVTEISANNFSAVSNSSFTTSTVVTTPSAPTSLSATAGNGQVSISFTAGSDGGSSITNYKYSTDGTNYTALSPTDSTSPVVITGLSNGTSYTFYLKAVNSVGDSVASSSVSATPVTPATTPSAPTSLSATAGNGQVSISFTAGSDGGSSITNYKYSTDGTNYTALSPTDSTSPVVITGLSNGTSYTFYLKAVNSVGDSVASSSVSATPATTAGAPTINTVTSGTQSLSVAFSAPSSNGGSSITNYKYSTDGGVTFTAFSPAQTTSPLTISGLTGGTSYSVQIKAVNNAGDGTASNSESGIPSSPASGGGSAPTVTPTPTPTPTVRPTTRPISNNQNNLVTNPLINTQPTPTPTPSIVPGTAQRPSPLTRFLIQDLIEFLRPKIIDLTRFATPTPAPTTVIETRAPNAPAQAIPTPRETFTNQQALNNSIDTQDKKVVELPSVVTIDNRPEPSKIVIVENTTAQVITPGGGLLNVEAKNGQNAVPVDNRGRVQMVRSNSVETEGTGMAPNSEFAVYLFSDPVLLGVGKTDANGKFFASFPVDRTLPIGDHTLQVNGLLASGKTASVSMPVTVVEDIATAKGQAMPKTIFVDYDPVDRAMNAIYWILIVLAVMMFLIAASFKDRFLILIGRRRKTQNK